MTRPIPLPPLPMPVPVSVPEPDLTDLVAMALAGWLAGYGGGLEALLDRVEGRA